MSELKRWTIRNVDPETIAIINSICAQSGATAGELVNEAILDWFENLEEDGEEGIDEL